ncbi:MAG: acetyltransferase [Chryseobacterium sp.]|jgi:hypothetical protein|uniref:GNAT family N-acetyltransferase n=1 Tax=Chryseobacterium sp. TaxID=1871047 RepID=UPI00281CB052|nr:GNAT family N-acetyltransferase [Chryseobacterium sp.]MDR2236655.1 acetyltransferase [Chryseobacterium sp.]
MSVSLYLLENKNWYYFDLVPKFDEELLKFMKSCPESGFIRIAISGEDSHIIVPVQYFSTTGVHFLADYAGYREKKMGTIDRISIEEAYRYLVSVTYGTQGVVDDIEKEYIGYFSEEFDESFGYGLKTTESSDTLLNCVKTGSISNFFGYQKENWKDFISPGITGNTDSDRTSSVLGWFSQYTRSLLKTAVGKYIEEGIIYNCNTEHVYIRKNTDPLSLCFNEYISDSSGIRKEKAENFIRTHLIYYNLYPFVRTIAYSEGIEEDSLYRIIDAEIDSLREVYGNAMDFLYETIEVRLFLKQVYSAQKESWKEYIRHHNFLINPKHYSRKLIKPDYGEILHKRYFNNGTLEITLRAFNPETDMEFLHEWSNMEYAKKYWEMDVEKWEFEEAYIKHMGVDYSHPYIGLLNGNPIFTLELYWAIKDEVGKYYRFRPGDYGFHMLIAPAKEKIPHFSTYALAMCMEYFFSFPQLTRMIGEASASHKGTHNLITKVGCEFNRSLALPYKTSNLTFLDREKFYETTEEIFNNSVLKINIPT